MTPGEIVPKMSNGKLVKFLYRMSLSCPATNINVASADGEAFRAELYGVVGVAGGAE